MHDPKIVSEETSVAKEHNNLAADQYTCKHFYSLQEPDRFTSSLVQWGLALPD